MIEENQKYPKITIITVVFNGAETLEQTILSVVKQTYKNIEYIIIDGGSTDGSIDIIKKYQDQISYWISELDNGIYDAMNKGVDLATGDYIYFLGADDFLCTKNTIDDIAKILTYDSVDLLSGPVWNVHETTCLQISAFKPLTLQGIYYGMRIPHQGMFLKTDLMKKYHFNYKYKIVADFDLCLNLFFNEKIIIKYIDSKVAFYSEGGISSVNIMNRIEEDAMIMRKYGIPEKYIRSHQTRSTSKKIRFMIKRVLFYMGFGKCLMKRKGWIEHTCENEFCRWCNNKFRI